MTSETSFDDEPQTNGYFSTEEEELDNSAVAAAPLIKVSHVVIVTVAHYDLWPIAREHANWEDITTSNLSAYRIAVERDSKEVSTATILLEQATHAATLARYIMARANALQKGEELLIVAHRPTHATVSGLALTNSGRVWTRKLIHMSSLPLYQAVRRLVEDPSFDTFDALVNQAKQRLPQWTLVDELLHDCIGKLRPLSFALKDWADEGYDEDYRAGKSGDDGAEKLFARYGIELERGLKTAQEKLYKRNDIDLLSVEQAVADVRSETEAAVAHFQSVVTRDEEWAQKIEKATNAVTRMERAWRALQILLPCSVNSFLTTALTSSEYPLYELRLQAFGENYGGGFLHLLLGLHETVGRAIISQVRDQLKRADVYSRWYDEFVGACEQLQVTMRDAEESLRFLMV